MNHVVLVSNAASGSSDEEALERVARSLGRLGEVVDVAPDSAESFGDALAEPLEDAALVVVAGGDGTLNCTINGIRDRIQDIHLGVVPMGTGNDLARTMGIPFDPDEAVAAIVAGSPGPLDVGVARCAGVERLFVNACMGGFPVSVDEAIEGAIKDRLGALAFWVGGAKVLRDLTRYDVLTQEHRWEGLLALGVGNGRTAGGGIAVFPDARPDDGLLDLCAIEADSVTEGVKLLSSLRSGEHVDLPSVHQDHRSRFVIESDPRLEFNVDGELVGMTTPVEFEVFGSTMLHR